MSDACDTYLFSTDDPFRSIGWDQSALFALIAQKNVSLPYTQKEIRYLLQLATASGLSYNTLHIELEFTLLSVLESEEAKRIALTKTEKLITEQSEKLKQAKNSMRQFYVQEAVNELCNMFVLLSVSLKETKNITSYYFTHYKEANKEIILYCLLQLMEYMQEDDLWIHVYEEAVNRRKINPRVGLTTEYNERLKKTKI